MSSSIVDKQIFQRFCMILKDKSANHIDMLSDGCEQMIHQMHQCDRTGVAFNAHKLKSSSGQMGATALAHFIVEVERAIGQSDNLAIAQEQHAQEAMARMVYDLERLALETQSALKVCYSQLGGD